MLLNVNVPSVPRESIKGVRVTRQGRMQFDERFDRRVDPQGRSYYWLTGEVVDVEEGPDVDSSAIREGYVSISPIMYDLTDGKLLDDLRAWDLVR